MKVEGSLQVILEEDGEDGSEEYSDASYYDESGEEEQVEFDDDQGRDADRSHQG